MNARTPNATQSESLSSVALLLDELEMPNTMAFAAFEDQLVALLAELEARFSDYMTHDSFAESMGR